jgi:hypothetical protein
MNTDDIIDEKLDDKWIKQFAESDKLYLDFYKDDVYYADIHFVYVNKKNEIVKINQESFLFNNKNYILRDELVGLIKRNSTVDSVRYSIMSILKYNITLDPIDIKRFVCGEDDDTSYMIPVSNIDTIKYDKTINMFQDLNDLLIVLYEKPVANPNNSTRKIYLHAKSKSKDKTTEGTRKQYKKVDFHLERK